MKGIKKLKKEIKDPDFKRLFIFKINSDNKSNIESYIAVGKTKEWVYDIYRASSASLEYVK